MKTIILGLLASLLLISCKSSYSGNKLKKHHCEWMNCKFENKSTFITEYDESTDFYYFMKNHFYHPNWSETQCDELRFKD